MRPRFIIAAFGLALALVMPAVSSAATLQFTNPNCSDFQVSSSSNGVVTLNCVLITAPVCTLTAATPNPVINSALNLTAACTGNTSGYTYTWSGGSTAKCTTSTCTDTQSAAGPVTYTVFATGAGSQGPPATATVTWVSQASAPPSGCTLAANPNALPAGGGSVFLTATCSGGGAPTQYSWTGGGIPALTVGNVQNPSITSTTTFTVTPSNSAGSGNTASATVTIAGSGGGGPPPGGQSFCANYQNVIFLDVPWGGVADTRSAGSNFLPNGVLVAKFTVPSTWSNAQGSVGKLQVAEFGDPPTYRQASLSSAACDFRGVANGQYDQYFRDITGQQPYPLQWAFGNTAVAEFTVTGNTLFRPQLQAGRTYYYNVRNWNPYGNGGSGSTSCGGSSCNAIISINTP
ncbi:MAG TPA: hypothetical protein VLR71_16765 [Casimicrobiaceae bacterium]|nr:hypothetical protein [Casimicrobiaceae bacterium]